MKKRMLELLACPQCHGTFTLKETKTREIAYDKEEEHKARQYCARKGIEYSLFTHDVVEGTLQCKCDAYPITNSIPRITQQFTNTKYDEMQKKTSSSFGFQWNQFREMYPQYKQNFLNYLGEIKPSFFEGKLVLDAGCGFARHSYYATEFGAEVVGMDLSEAVESAQKNLEKFPLSHIVQSDIYKPPFQKKFDLIFSIGVLHHLPDPEGGFKSLVELSRKGGVVFVWVYGKEGRLFKLTVMEAIHSIAKHVPHAILYYLCFIPATIYHLTNLLYLGLKKLGLNTLAKFLSFQYYAQFPFRVKHADSFDFLSTQVNNYYTKEELKAWFDHANLPNATITNFNKRSWRGYAVKQQE